MSHKLSVKTHKITGLKYLSYSTLEGQRFLDYPGSGTLWREHISIHGDHVDSELIYETENFEEFKQFSIKFSIENNIVLSTLWTNLILESGHGGDTVSKKFWITDGVVDKYNDIGKDIPPGFVAGRTNCVFKDKQLQSEFASRRDPENHINSLINSYVKRKAAGIEIAPWMKTRVGKLNTASKQLSTPYGIFESISAAAISLDISKYRISKNIKLLPEEWVLL